MPYSDCMQDSNLVPGYIMQYVIRFLLNMSVRYSKTFASAAVEKFRLWHCLDSLSLYAWHALTVCE